MSEDVILYDNPPDANIGYWSHTHPLRGRIYTYPSDPGIYFYKKYDQCVQASMDEAREAGFEVDSELKERGIRQILRAKEAELREEMAIQEARIRKDGVADPTAADVLPEHPLVTRRNDKDEPRGTEHFLMDYVGGGNTWRILDNDEEMIEEKLGKTEAFERMILLTMEKNDELARQAQQELGASAAPVGNSTSEAQVQHGASGGA